MNKYRFFILVYLLIQFSVGHTTICPDPKTSSLKWGVPPDPWIVNPVSPHRPQGDENTRFVRANILVAGYGRGIVCTYRNSIGEYSIWWPTLTKIPSRHDSNWIENSGGFVCFQVLEQCRFYGG